MTVPLTGPQSVVDPLLQLLHDQDLGGATSDAVYGSIREAILRGLLPAGSRLAEEELARRFGTSRTPIREALLRVEAEQLADRLPRGGLVVRTITPEEILQVYVVRESIEGLSARLAAEVASRADVQQLRWLNAQLSDAADRADLDEMTALNLEWHESLCRAGRNALLYRMLQQVHDRVRRFTGTTYSNEERRSAVAPEHEAILHFIEAHDPDGAEAVARQHMKAALAIRIEAHQQAGGYAR